MGIHFAIAQIISGGVLAWLMQISGLGEQAYYQYAIVLTGITAILAFIPAVYFYKKDHFARVYGGMIPEKNGSRLCQKEMILLLLMGGGLAIYGNLLVNLLHFFMEMSEYQELMSQITQGKSLLMMIFWMGIVAPTAEEGIFRWLVYLRLRDYLKSVKAAAVISAVIFGVYHGNLLQAIYASVLGFFFAMILEKTGSLLSCVLLHAGANLTSILVSESAAVTDPEKIFPYLSLFIVAVMAAAVGGIWYYFGKRKDNKSRLL